MLIMFNKIGFTSYVPKPRSQQVNAETTVYYHCISRCVRRAFLCGADVVSGRSFDHRRQWLADRMKQLSTIFAIDICAYGLMSNHFHVVLRLDRGRAERWSEDEVTERCSLLFPRVVADARALSPEQWQVKVALWRRRLWDLSWYMRCLNEAIARRANREDKCTGRFWEGRFRSQALLDEGALLTCMSYVDLNPIRAGTAETLEESLYTAIRERLLAAARPQPEPAPGLVPFADQANVDVEALPVRFDEYVDLLRWTAGSLRAGTVVAPGAEVENVLGRCGLEAGGWVEAVANYRRRFFTMVGQVQRIDVECERRGYKRRLGRRAAQSLYRAA